MDCLLEMEAKLPNPSVPNTGLEGTIFVSIFKHLAATTANPL